MMIRLLLSILFISLTSVVSAELSDYDGGIPDYFYFSKGDMGLHGILGSIAQKSNGDVLVGSDRLVSYDGDKWESVPVANSEVYAGMDIDELGNIWLGGYGRFGYLPKLNTHIYGPFVDLWEQAGMDPNELVHTYNLHSIGNHVYLVTKDRVVVWNGDALKIHDFETDWRIFSFIVNGQLFISDGIAGLHVFRGDSPELFLPLAAFESSPCVWGASLNQGKMILGSGDTLFLVEKNEIVKKIQNGDYSDLKTAGIVEAALFEGKYIVVSTWIRGLAIFDLDGTLIRYLDEESGLPTQNFTALKIDQESGLWAGSGDGLFYFPNFGKNWIFDNRNGLDNSIIRKIEDDEENLYVLSRKNLYFKGKNQTEFISRFKTIPDLAAPVDDILLKNNMVYASNLFGINAIRAGRPKLVYQASAPNNYSLLDPQSNGNIVTSLESSLACLNIEIDHTFSENTLLDIGGTIDAMVLGPDSEVWIANSQSGIFRVKLIHENGKIKSGHLIRQYVLNENQAFADSSIKLGNNEGKIIALSQNGNYYFDEKSDQFVSIEALEGWIGTGLCAVSNDNANCFWLGVLKKVASNEPGPLLVKLSTSPQGTIQTVFYWTPTFGKLGRINTVFVDDSPIQQTRENDAEILWIGGEGLLQKLEIDDSMVLRSPPAAVIKRIYPIGSDEVDIHATPRQSLKIGYRDVGLHFSFGVENRRFGEKFQYSTFIDGVDSTWREPSNQNSFELAGLREGSYVLRTRAVNIAGLAGPEARFSFEVMPPWHRTVWAYGCYLILIMLASYLFYRLRTWQQRIRTHQLEEVVQLRTRQLEEANAAKNEFLSRMSHELRNPMNGVIGSSELLGESGLDGDQKSLVQIIHSCARHLNQMIGDILDFSRVDADRVTLDNRPFQLESLVREVVDVNRFDADIAEVTLSVDWEDEIPHILEADAAKIRQILINFISNSIKYGRSTEVVLRIHGVSVLSNTASVTFEVIDHGPGIADDEKELIFHRFYRSRDVVNSKVRGTGVGLAVCKAFADCMGADIGVRDNPEGGSIFYFRVNLKISEKRSELLGQSGVELDLRGQSALVVDDMEYNRMVSRRLLETLELEVDLAKNGTEALDLLRSKQYHFVFMDWDLPDFSGVEVTRRFRNLKRDGKDHYTRIFATTAYSTRQKYMECIRSGMDGFLGKPITLDKLRELLSSKSVRPFSELPGGDTLQFDLSTIEFLSQGDPESFRKNIKLYLTTLKVELDSMEAALKKQSAEALRKCAHRLLSHTAIINAQDLTNILREIQELARCEKLEKIPDLVATLLEDATSLAKQMESHLEKT